MARSRSIKFDARLHADNEDERRAIEILEQYESYGLSRREILTRSLLALGERPIPETPDALAETLSEMIQELKSVISRAGQGGAVIQPAPDEPTGKVKINPALVNSLQSRRKGR